jgi:hypothetical protein
MLLSVGNSRQPVDTLCKRVQHVSHILHRHDFVSISMLLGRPGCPGGVEGGHGRGGGEGQMHWHGMEVGSLQQLTCPMAEGWKGGWN